MTLAGKPNLSDCIQRKKKEFYSRLEGIIEKAENVFDQMNVEQEFENYL